MNLDLPDALKDQLKDEICTEQEIKYWILRNSWGKNERNDCQKKGDVNYRKGIVHVAFCDTYIIDGQKRRVNLTFGIEICIPEVQT